MRDAIEAGEKLKSVAKIFGGSILGIVTLGLSAYGAHRLWPRRKEEDPEADTHLGDRTDNGQGEYCALVDLDAEEQDTFGSEHDGTLSVTTKDDDVVYAAWV